MSSNEEEVRERLRQKIGSLQSPRDRVKQKIERLSATPGILDPEPSGFQVFMNNAVRGVSDAVLQTPRIAGDLMALGTAGVQGTIGGLVPGGRGFEYRDRYEGYQNTWPVSAMRSPAINPDTHQAVAAVGALPRLMPGGESYDDAYTQLRSTMDKRQAAERESNPIAAEAGEIGGSIASLLLAKSPLQATIRRTEQDLMRRTDLYFGGAQTAAEATGPTAAAARAMNANISRLMTRGGLRATETGLEAAFLSVLNEAETDPILAAGLAAGGQVMSSAAIEALKGATSIVPNKPLLSITVSALSTAGLWQIIKEATPGGRDWITESVETGYGKVAAAIGLGMLGGMVGARGRDAKVYEDFLPVSEALMTVPRGTILHYLTQAASAPPERQQEFEQALEALSQDPEYDGETEFQREMVRDFREATEANARGVRRGTIDRSRNASVPR